MFGGWIVEDSSLVKSEILGMCNPWENQNACTQLNVVFSKWTTFLTSGQSALQYCLTFTHSCTHSHTDGGVNNARWQAACLDQLGLGVLLRDTSTRLGGAGDRTSNLPVTTKHAIPPEPHVAPILSSLLLFSLNLYSLHPDIASLELFTTWWYVYLTA